MSEDTFEKLLERYRKAIEEKGGEASFEELVEWAQREDMGSMLVVAVILNEMVSRGVAEAPQGYRVVEGLDGLAAPSVVKLLKTETSPPEPMPSITVAKTVTPATLTLEEVKEDLEVAVAYLNDYWSVGELRFLDDLKALGVKDPGKVLKKLLELGYVERTPSGVINATEKLPKVRRGLSLAEFT
ncbi:MAG: hypothetical protein DRJ98_02305 [Thermoprotei archaeon]|nr:MAG: hypothetical protein DRJ98_02305 [Thermoprotei archaeon]